MAKTAEVIETEAEPAEQDPRHKGAGSLSLSLTHTHAHTWSTGGGGWLTAWDICRRRHQTCSRIRSLALSDGRSGTGCRQPGQEQEVCWG